MLFLWFNIKVFFWRILERSEYNCGEGISNSRQIFLWLVWPKINLSVIGALLWIYHCITEQWLRHTFFLLSKMTQKIIDNQKSQNYNLLYYSGSLLNKITLKNNVCCWFKITLSAQISLSLNEKKFVQFPPKFIRLCMRCLN